MKVVIQRVKHAGVTIDNVKVSFVDKGFLISVSYTHLTLPTIA